MRRNEDALVADLTAQRLVFRARPHEAHVQFSTHCNQSCVMCWNGENPPVVDIDPLVLERLGHEVAPTLSILIPHDGSEPTSRMWHTICAFTRTHGLRMHLTTNVQGLSARRLRDALDIVVSLDLSVDSHSPEVLARLRPGARTRAIYRNLPELAAIADAAAIDCEVNVVFTTENAVDLPITIERFSAVGVRALSVIRLVDTNGRSGAIDPLVHLGPEQVRTIRNRSIAAAEHAGIRLRWLVDDAYETSVESAAIPDAEVEVDARNTELRLAHPGFCRFVHSGLRVRASGDLAPCGYATGTDLHLGSLAHRDFASIWNGTTAQDLRRAMYTGDLPEPCSTCQHADPPPEQSDLPMQRWLRDPGSALAQIVAPDHMLRTRVRPRFEVDGVSPGDDDFVLLVARGGAREVREWHRMLVAERRGERVVLELETGALWSSMQPNTGYWWVIGRRDRLRRFRPLTTRARCLIRSEPIPRITGSTLRYGASAVEPVLVGFPARHHTRPVEAANDR